MRSPVSSFEMSPDDKLLCKMSIVKSAILIKFNYVHKKQHNNTKQLMILYYLAKKTQHLTVQMTWKHLSWIIGILHES